MIPVKTPQAIRDKITECLEAHVESGGPVVAWGLIVGYRNPDIPMHNEVWTFLSSESDGDRYDRDFMLYEGHRLLNIEKRIAAIDDLPDGVADLVKWADAEHSKNIGIDSAEAHGRAQTAKTVLEKLGFART